MSETKKENKAETLAPQEKSLPWEWSPADRNIFFKHLKRFNPEWCGGDI